MSEVVDHWTYPLRRGETVADQDWVPIYFHKLLGSRLVARACAAGAEGRAAGFAAMLLWFEAVRQDPAGTLPDDDVELARLAGYGPDVQAWRVGGEIGGVQRAWHGALKSMPLKPPLIVLGQ